MPGAMTEPTHDHDHRYRFLREQMAYPTDQSPVTLDVFFCEECLVYTAIDRKAQLAKLTNWNFNPPPVEFH
jgi:hypothetical protein